MPTHSVVTVTLDEQKEVAKQDKYFTIQPLPGFLVGKSQNSNYTN